MSTSDLERLHLRLLDDVVSLAFAMPEDASRRAAWRVGFDMAQRDAERITYAITARKGAKL
jgi:hypothetical protein